MAGLGAMFFSIWIPKATVRQFSCAVLAAFLGRFKPVYMVACCSEGGWCGRIVRLFSVYLCGFGCVFGSFRACVYGGLL